MSDGITTIKHFKALEELFDNTDKSADALAAYYMLKEHLQERRNPKIVRSKNPLLLQTMDSSGNYVYEQRETQMEV